MTRHSNSVGSKAVFSFLLATCFLGSPFRLLAADKPVLDGARRVVVLGDSITYGGGYVEFIEAWFVSRYPERRVEFINVGLPSETVSGLSEPGHAGGKFPRPDLHERLARVLAQTKPDLVVACYGMNDGIYYPFGEERFRKYQDGIRWLREQVAAAGAKIIHLTPPVFDPLPIKERTLPAGRDEYQQPFEGYNGVLDRYSAWLLEQRQAGWEVVDVHGAMNRFIAERRQQDANFTLARDGVHCNETGHWIMAKQLLLHWGAKDVANVAEPNTAFGEPLLKLLHQRQQILKDAWLTATGHQRPGMKTGLPLAEAKAKAAELDKQILPLTVAQSAPEIRRDRDGQVTITCAATNLVIRYTLNGSDPTRDAGAYLAPIPLSFGGTVKARVFSAGDKTNGPVVTTTFDALGAATRPHSALLPITQNRDWRSYDWPARHAAVLATVRARKPDLVFIGDSITHFWGGEPRARTIRGAEAWDRLCSRRNAVNLGFGWDRTENVLWRLQHGELDGASPKAVVVLIGTNNLDVNTPDEIADGIRAVCGELHTRLPQARILLLAILPRSAKPDARRAKLAEVNARIARLDGKNGVTFLDIGAKFIGPDGSIPPELMNDYLHPTAKGYAVFADAIEPTLAKLMGEPAAAPAPFPGKKSVWNGFDRYDFEVAGKPALVVVPRVVAPGRPWVWHGEFFGHKPAPDIALLGRGFHIVYLRVPDMLGCPDAVTQWNAFHQELTGKYGFAKKAALVGLSRGGLYCYNWAIANPDKVACIYGDAPVCDFKSWPGGKGKGKGSKRDWDLVLKVFHFANEADALAYKGNPVDNLKSLASARVPLLHVFGDADDVVPWDENTGVIAERYQQLGGNITLIRKPGVNHHPHGLDDSTPIVNFLWEHTASAEAKAWLAQHGGGPVDAAGRPLIRKLGTVDLDLVEATPIVFNGRLWRFEWIRQSMSHPYWDNRRGTNYFRFRDPATGEVTSPFADGHEFGSAFVQGDTVYVTGTLGRDRVNLFTSRDFKTWETRPVITAGRYGIFNTSLCRAGDEFVLMFEIDKPPEEAGRAFTARFAKSRDLRTWALTPPECNYAKDRYTAPHALRWLDGWFYNFYLEAHQGYEMRVVRSRDLLHWEASPLNPVLRASPEDKGIANAKLTAPQRERIAWAANTNNSDIDFCDWQGRLVIYYSWGNQKGIEQLAEAAYDGSEAQFLRGWFPGLATKP